MSTAPHQPDNPGYRMRDFSPESRQTRAATPVEAPAPWSPQVASGDLKYQTSAQQPDAKSSARPQAFQSPEVVPESPVERTVAEQAAAQPPVEHTLTRRELRAIRNAASPTPPTLIEPNNVEPSEPQAIPLPVVLPPIEDVFPAKQDSAVEVHPETLVEAHPEPEAEPEIVVEASEPPSFTAVIRPPVFPEAPAAQVFPEVIEPTVIEPEAALPEPLIEPLLRPTRDSHSAQSADDLVIPGTPAASELPTDREVVVAPEFHTPPPPAVNVTEHDHVTGHIRDLSISDAITTSALVLPSLPADPITSAVSRSGEVLVTGSIDLPRSLSALGISASHETRDIDLDDDLEDGQPSSAPVRAIRAVSSSHTSSHGLIASKRHKTGRFPMMALAVSGAVMAGGVVVLLVGGVVLNIF
ncbi:hypothetical protein [Cryobacterium sp. BB736]|uniref:hypothetical protein n=1 Tax=Cryobacterium sp. BB736 TaxID=2746963 RepID=UPI0018774729|nr:hypothetical protein [Cryobacterium sp. BB736]